MENTKKRKLLLEIAKRVVTDKLLDDLEPDVRGFMLCDGAPYTAETVKAFQSGLMFGINAGHAVGQEPPDTIKLLTMALEIMVERQEKIESK